MANKIYTVFVADDDEFILDVISIMLGGAGYVVKTTNNAEDLFSIIGDSPDLILLDLWMSGINGKDICIKLKNQLSTKHIPIILISANSNVEEIVRQCGADDYISKPFEMDALLQKVSDTLMKFHTGDNH